MTENCIETDFNPAELLQISFLKKVYKTIEEINIKEGFKNLSEYERDIINNILHMFLIKLFTVNGKYINKSERKIIDKLIVVVNYDIKRIEKVNELVEQSLYFLNHLTSKKILIKTKKKDIYYRLNKEYIEELKRIDEEVANKDRIITDLRIQINNVEEEIWNLRNERANIKQKITKLKNKNRKKYGVAIIRKNYKEDIVEEFETLNECYDYIDRMTRKNKVSNIRIDINPERN